MALGHFKISYVASLSPRLALLDKTVRRTIEKHLSRPQIGGHFIVAHYIEDGRTYRWK